MKRHVAIMLLLGGGSLPAQIPFTRDVAPILAKNCLSCHSASQKMSQLDLSSRAAAVQGGQKNGPAIVPGDAAKSPLYRRLTGQDQPSMPLGSRLSDAEIKHMMREGFRRLRVHPVPSFASLITALRKNPDEPIAEPAPDLRNCDAVPATERERMANVLHRELDEAARAIATRLKLGEAKFAVVREQLETVEGAVISEFTPLV